MCAQVIKSGRAGKRDRGIHISQTCQVYSGGFCFVDLIFLFIKYFAVNFCCCFCCLWICSHFLRMCFDVVGLSIKNMWCWGFLGRREMVKFENVVG